MKKLAEVAKLNSANISKCKGFYHLVPGCVVASTELSPLPRTAASPTFLLQQAAKKINNTE